MVVDIMRASRYFLCWDAATLPCDLELPMCDLRAQGLDNRLKQAVHEANSIRKTGKQLVGLRISLGLALESSAQRWLHRTTCHAIASRVISALVTVKCTMMRRNTEIDWKVYCHYDKQYLPTYLIQIIIKNTKNVYIIIMYYCMYVVTYLTAN